MSEVREFSLEPVRTDGWFERIGDGIASFQALCEIIGPKFFAFAMIGGARITALTVDRRIPDNTQVDFVVGSEGDEISDEGIQRVPLSEFRRRLVAALVQEEPLAPPPEHEDDLEALQQHLGVGGHHREGAGKPWYRVRSEGSHLSDSTCRDARTSLGWSC